MLSQVAKIIFPPWAKEIQVHEISNIHSSLFSDYPRGFKFWSALKGGKREFIVHDIYLHEDGKYYLGNGQYFASQNNADEFYSEKIFA